MLHAFGSIECVELHSIFVKIDFHKAGKICKIGMH